MRTPRWTLVTVSVLAASCALGSVLITSQVGAQGRAPSQESRAIPECRGRALVGLSLGSGAGLGNVVNAVGVVNVGKTSCRLGGYPGLEGTRLGHAYTLVVSHGTYFGNLSPTVLAPRVVGALLLATGDGCPALNQPNQDAVRAEIAAHTFTGVVIELPLHDGFVHVNGVRFDTACGFSSSRLGWRSDLLGNNLTNG